jgi:hypothetical protein
MTGGVYSIKYNIIEKPSRSSDGRLKITRSISRKDKNSLLPHNAQISSGAHSPSYSMDTRDIPRVGKAAGA